MSQADALGALPEWDLSDLYPGPDSPALTTDLDNADTEAKAFRDAYAGKLASLDGAGMAAAVQRYEALGETMGRIMSYAQLLHAGNVADPDVGKFYQSMQERVNAIASLTLFFVLEMNHIDDARMAALLQNPTLARYRPWIEAERVMKPYQLDDEMEQLLHEKSVAGAAAWSRLFDQTVAGLRFKVGKQEMTSEQALHLLSEPDAKARKQAAMALAKTFEANVGLFAHIYNTLVKDKEIEDRWRKLPSPQMARHLSNRVEPEVVQALRDAVWDAFPKLSHRYYALKAKWLGMKKMEFWDRNAPLPDVDDRTFTFPQARDVVLDAYGQFSPELASVGKRFFDQPWIDAPTRPGKAGGAFAHPTVVSAHPYLLLNYQGKTRDVMTLAHELGHGVHQILAAEQGPLLSYTPLTLAETASVFGEQLTFRALLAAETEPARRKAMLASKVEDMINTVVRQTAFYEFESRVHAQRREGELTPDALCQIWMDVQAESLGPAIKLRPEYRTYWCYIMHFVHAPFYVYAYAFGDCLVNSLYAVYQGAEAGFQDKYLDLLRAGGTKRHKELLAPFGLDASDPAFWQKGLGVISSFIDELETL
ncbi:MAG: M3 family oligoendopeptidase [Alphaproteobacteria bacterium]